MCFYKKWFKNEYSFGATVFRYAFALLFILVAVKKFRMGYGGFAESLVTADTLLAKEMPHFILYLYGYLLPAAELIAGVLLAINKHTRYAYALIAVIYLTFIFGQMYNLNTAKIGTEYFPSLIALSLAVYLDEKARTA